MTNLDEQFFEDVCRVFKEDAKQPEYLLKYDFERLLKDYVSRCKGDCWQDGYDEGYSDGFSDAEDQLQG